MDEMIKTNINTINNASKKALECIKKLKDLKYVNLENYEKNIKDFGFCFIDESDTTIFSELEFAWYIPSMNKIALKESIIKMGYINEEYLTILFLHELVHLSSTSRETGIIGYENSIMTITFNESCTQYMALKLYYGENLDNKIDNSLITKPSRYYLESKYYYLNNVSMKPLTNPESPQLGKQKI